MNEQVKIHPTAIVDPKAKLGVGVEVGPFTVIGGEVEVGDRTKIQERVSLRGITSFGADCEIFPGAVIGGDPQHTKYKGEPTKVQIGNRVRIREGVTVHRGTEFGTGLTTVGDDTFLMAYSHVGHDCSVGKNTIIVNAVLLAGHVIVEDFVTIGGMVAVSQFCRVGRYAFVAGGSILRKDLLPFMTGKGTDFDVQGINVVGLKRNGFSAESVSAIKKVFRIFYKEGLTVPQAVEKMQAEISGCDELPVFLEFIKQSKMGFTR